MYAARFDSRDTQFLRDILRTRTALEFSHDQDPQETCAAQDFRTAKALFVPSLKRGIIPPLHE
jgi:hypothetical protein